MIEHMFPDFLDDSNSYRASQDYWRAVWMKTNRNTRYVAQWEEPWMVDNPDLKDGNPIFTAWSPLLQKGIRVIQHAPTSDRAEIVFWVNTFGGDMRDPESVRELVIACALSPETSLIALSLFNAWLAGNVAIRFFTEQAFAAKSHVADSVVETESSAEAA